MRLIKLVVIFFLSVIWFIACTPSDKQGYNEGFKNGYEAGLDACKKQDISIDKGDDAVKNKKTDPNLNTENVTEDIDAADNPDIPQKAIVVLNYIKENDKAPEGYVGGRTFGNYERHLPERDAAGNKIKYREWDIHPKVEGKNRGAQRLVTSSDGRAWYTADHYNSFTEVKVK